MVHDVYWDKETDLFEQFISLPHYLHPCSEFLQQDLQADIEFGEVDDDTSLMNLIKLH